MAPALAKGFLYAFATTSSPVRSPVAPALAKGFLYARDGERIVCVQFLSPKP